MDNITEINEIKSRYESVWENICSSAKQSGRNCDEIKVVVVSKRQPISKIQSAIRAGIKNFGENYPEEAIEKIKMIDPEVSLNWHMIGHIQSRKVKLLGCQYKLVHSVDRMKIAKKISDLCVLEECNQEILLEMNVSGEESKFGWPAYQQNDWNELADIADEIDALPNISVKGLMTMPPLTNDEAFLRKCFNRLFSLKEFINENSSCELIELSMGTSADYQLAIEEGATIVRIGQAILGPR